MLVLFYVYEAWQFGIAQGHTTAAALLYTPPAPTENGLMTRKIQLWPIRGVMCVHSSAHASVLLHTFIVAVVSINRRNARVLFTDK